MIKVIKNGCLLGHIAPLPDHPDHGKLWGFFPQGETEPSLKAHGAGSFRLLLRRWFGGDLAFEEE